MKIKKIDHFVITSIQPKNMASFYRELGFEIVDCTSHFQMFAGDFKINMHIYGSSLYPHAKNIQMGCSDFCMEIEENLEEFKINLEKKGIEIEEGIVPRNGTNGSMNSIYLRDPDGNLIEFCSYN